MKALIDADVIVYHCAFTAQRKLFRFKHDNGKVSDFVEGTTKTDIKINYPDLRGKGKLVSYFKVDPPAFACEAAKRMLNTILRNLETDEHELYLTSTSKKGYRYQLHPEYKAGRPARPYHWEVVRNYLIDYWGAVEAPEDIEADDMLGLNQTNSTVICSIDKDLNMIPGWHYDTSTKEKYYIEDPGYLNFAETSAGRKKLVGGGLLWFYAQLLLGDSADNIPGIKGYGPVKTYKTLKDCKKEKDMLHLVSTIYKKRATIEQLDLVAQLLWIQRPRRKRWIMTDIR